MSEGKKILEINIPELKRATGSVFRGASDFALSTAGLPRAFVPVIQLIINEQSISRDELSQVLDELFANLYEHPVSEHSKTLTAYLRRYRIIPNEQSTENLIRFLVKQTVARSPVEIPEAIIDEFWNFFQELIAAPELKGLVELNLDITRLVLRTYEPLLVELVNKTKQLRSINRKAVSEMLQKVQVLRGDLLILRRQIKAIRYIKPFLQTDPKDFSTQAEIVAKMVREFGPLFIKMAQVAAANSDFLPEEIARELKVFQEDVEPMTPDEVNQTFLEEFGHRPETIYFDFDVNKPIKSGSIGSVYLAKKPVMQDDVEILVPVIVKVARHNLEREFTMGALAIELMLVSSQYWAPHSKLRPFLSAMAEQIKEFTRGFEQELDFSSEAEIQSRFAHRAESSHVWSVPHLYRTGGRILEMEYLQEALAINNAIESFTGNERSRFQRKLAENFIYTMLEHLIIYQEFHGDLHPGNIMVTRDAHLFLIDWGNTVDMEGKWSLLWNYWLAVFVGDADKLAHMLIEMSTDVEANRERFEEIRQALEETLKKKEVTPLKRHWARTLYREGREGLYGRLQTAMHLMSNTYQLGIIVQSDYLHLSRSLFAMAGTYSNLYKDISRVTMLTDLVKDLTLFPYHLAKDRFPWNRVELKNQLS